MATVRVAIDNIQNPSADKKTLEAFAEKLRQAGHTVTTHGVGPNRIQGVMRKSSNACDLMIQVAGGKCIGTAGDFYVGLDTGYYHAKAGGFAYFKCYKADWKIHRAGDDNFSNKPGTRVKREVDAVLGQTLPEVYKKWNRMYFGYGNTADECAKTFLENYGGSSAGTGTQEQAGGGGSILDRLKEVCSDWNKYGVSLELRGDTVEIKRTNMNNTHALTDDNILANSIVYNDYDVSTPNTYKTVSDDYLIGRYGKVPLEDEEDTSDAPSSWNKQILQMSQRGHGHSIDVKVPVDPFLVEGQWVSLTLKGLGIQARPYYSTKSSYEDERVMGLTLEPGPPEVYQEVVEETIEEETVEEDTTEEE